jgi:hypothetical protein
MEIYYKSSITFYMFRTLMLPSSGRRVTKNKIIELLNGLIQKEVSKKHYGRRKKNIDKTLLTDLFLGTFNFLAIENCFFIMVLC